MAREATVDQICRMLGLETSKNVRSAAGSRAAHLFQTLHGRTPRNENAPKTAGGGTHHKNYYPEEFWPEIERILRIVGAEETRQGRLF
jgi:hypothetical protein